MKKPDFKTLLAEIISWSSFPPLVGTIFFVFLVFKYSQDLTEGFRWLIAISPFLMFAPLLFFAISFHLGWISDIDLSHREERPTFLAVFIASLAVASATLLFLKVPREFFVYVFSGLIMMVVTSIITLYWKISYHAAVTASVLTAIVILGGSQYAPIYLLLVPIGWSRVVLKRHTLNQVIGGVLVASAVTIGVFYLFGFKFFI